ncbi:unnamed protein product [Acanthoscelides obtectus]|uniref:Uncharacterized protein n=1 Tax=Acanthoscelides obtectus TaxID=200917 RepID=A0A9P0L6D2_ACAOB|nr:unnamed protein product [Acanthoscelides obtectus]CAK1630068.1 hypothetical protein AOBTE_LOCUS6138 [Acanthoscelides obtectus]
MINLWIIVVWATVNILMKPHEIFSARLQAKASKNVHDFHTALDEIQGYIWKANILRLKMILLHPLEDDCRLVHAE